MKKYIDYIVCGMIGFLVILFVFFYQHIFSAPNTKDIWRIISDACYLAGVLIFGSGVLVWVSNEGAFHMMSYGVKKVVNLFRKEENKSSMEKTYFEYHLAMQDEKKHVKPILLVGGIYLILAIISTIIYSSI